MKIINNLMRLIRKPKTVGITRASNPESIDFTDDYTLATLSAYLKKMGFSVVCSNDVHRLLSCDVVWCTANSEAWEQVNRLGKIIVEHKIPFWVGGHHASALPHTLLHGRAFIGPLEHCTSLDELPLPDFSIIHNPKYNIVITSRGCPYSCNFCSSSSFWKTFRQKSPERVVEEIKWLTLKGARHIFIFDDLFIANKKWLQKFVMLIEMKELNKIQYSCLFRSNLIDQEMVNLLKRMNIVSMAFGAESGSNKIIHEMNKKTTVDDNQRAIDILFQNGYKATTSLVAGYPNETKDDLLLTKEFIRKNREKCEAIHIYPCIPFPGTKIYDLFKKLYGIEDNEVQFDHFKIAADRIDRESYYLLTQNYDQDFLVEVLEWNREESAAQASRSS